MKKTMVLKMAIAAALLTASVISEASVNWTRPVASGDGDWGTSANWDTAPSATTDYTYLGTAASNADIEVTDSETYGYRMVLGHTSSVPPVLTIKNGGTLSQGTYSTGSHSYVGRNSGGDGHMVIEAGGTFSTNAKLYIGLYSGSEGTVDVSGTLDLSGGYGKLVFGDSTTNGTGYLNILDGGVVILSTFQDTYKGFELSDMSSTSEIDILGTGKMVADGNSLSYAQAIIDSDQVYGNGILGNVEASYDSIEDETTITAIPLTYTLTVNNGTGDGDYEEDSVNNISADAPATGYVFDAWTGDTAYVANVNSASTTVTMPAAAVSVTATYELETYALTVTNGTGDGSYVMDSVNNITADAPAAGYVFDAWTGDTAYVANVNSASTTVTMPAAAVSVTATYELETYALTVTNGTGDGSYVMDSVNNITADAPAAGYVFDAWTGDTAYVANVNSASTTVTMPAAAVSVTATYVLDTYTLTVNNGTGDGSYVMDSVNNITADAPAAGYVFDAWTGDTAYVANVNSASTTVTMPAAAVSVTATYELDTYTLTVNNGTGDGSYVMDSVNNITADAPATGYVFDAWTGDTAYVANVNSSSTTVTMPAGPVTVTATYEATTSTWARATASGAGNWNDPNNWDGGVPTATTQEVCTAVSDANLAEIQVTNAQTFGLALKHGNNAVATTSGPLIRIQNGGSLSWGDTSTANSYIGYTSNAQMTIETGGTLTTGRRLFVGNYTGVTGTLNIAGTLDISGTYGKLYVGNAGTGYVNVNDGGLLKLNQFGSSYNGILITAGSTLDIIGTGKVVCDGNDLSDAEALIAGGRVAGDGVLGNVEASYNSVEDETTITAITATYTLTVNNGTGDGDYEEDSVNNITADAPAAGYVFDVWTGDTAYVADVNDPNTTVTMPAAAVTVTATYEPLYTLTVTNGTGDGSYIEDSVNNITADTPAAGYVFDAWTGDTAYVADVNDPNTTVTMPAAAVSVTATYELETYALTVTNGTGDGNYAMGSVNAIAADAAASGYVFAEWTGDTAYVTDVDDPTTNVTMPAGAVSVTATYIIENSTWTRATASGVGNWSITSNWDEDAAPVAATEYTYTGAASGLAEIEVTDAETYGYSLIHGSASSSTEAPVLRIKNEGSLSQGTYDVGSNSFVGKTNTAEMVIEAGGYFSTNARLYIGMYSGSEGTVDVAGTLDLSGGYGKLCLGGSSTIGTGYLNILDGGIVKLSTFQDTYKGFELSAMSSTSLIDIQGSGKMFCAGDAVGYANAIISAGQIKGDGVLGNVEANYVAGLDITTITVTPDPPSTWARATASGAGNWNDPNNWDEGGVPGSSDETYTAVSDANLAEIQVTDTQTFGLVLKHGYNKVATTDGPVIRIQNGGSLSDAASASDSYIGYTSSAQMIVEAGGTFTTSQKLYIGKDTDVIGIVDIAGTFDISDVNGLLVLGGDGTGYVNVLNGGLLELNSFNGLTIEAGSILDIYGTGEVVADGNSLSAAEALIASDRIAGDGILSNVVASYDSGEDETTITVIAGTPVASAWARTTASGAGNWNVAANWYGGVPSSSTDETHTAIDANDLAEIQVTNSQTFGLRLFHGNNAVATTDGPVIRIENGGSLSWEDTSTANSYIGYNSSAQMIIEDGGTFTTGRKLHLGVYPGVTGTVDIAGTMDLTDGLYGGLVLGNGTVGTGIVDVNDGGTLELNSIDSVTISDGSMLDVTGTGKIVIDGNEVSDAEVFIESGHASGDGILRNLVATYDSGQDETTITSHRLLTIVDDGDPNLVIIIGTDATETEEYAADELQLYLYKMSGATVPIVTESGTLPATAIVIGTPDTCQHIDDSGLVPESSLSRDGLRIKTVEDVLYLAGEYPSGALYATYAFLEEHLGCRWYFPGTDGEYVPSMTTITTGRINDTQEPAMEFRGIHVVGDATKSPEVATWMARNRMNYISQIPFYSYHRSKFEENIKKGMLCNTETHLSHWIGDLFSTHPEYYCLVDGVRVNEGNYCLSNLNLVDVVADAIEDHVELFPEIEIIGINQIDSTVWCECASCTALGTLTDRLHTFINRLVAELDSRGSILDNRVLSTQAYLGTDPLPVNVTPNEKLIIQYTMVTHCTRHGWNENCPSQAFQKNRLNGWLGYGNKVIAYTYHAELFPGYSMPLAYHSLDEIKYYNEIGMSGWYPETNCDAPGMYELGSDPNLVLGDQWYGQKELYYTAAKALWDPNVTLDEFKDDYFPRFYGDAGSAMQDYYDALEDAWHYPENVLYPHIRFYNFYPSIAIDFLNPTLINAMNGYLDDAVDLYDEESQVIQDRVDRDVDMFDKWDQLYDLTGGIPSR